MIVHPTAEAERDLEQIGDWIARDNPARAITFIEEIQRTCLDLAEFPERFPLVPRYEDRRVHRTKGNYLIFYRVAPAKVVILHVVRGAMDYSALLFPE